MLTKISKSYYIKLEQHNLKVSSNGVDTRRLYMSKTVEIVTRDPKNQRIQAMFRADLSDEIRSEIKIGLENVLYKQTMQFEYLFQLIDFKQLSGLLMEMKTSVLGVDEYRRMGVEEKKIFSSQYYRDLDSIFNCLINIVTQLLIDVKKFPDGFFDQSFIRSYCYF